jgi:hypothetical protein
VRNTLHISLALSAAIWILLTLILSWPEGAGEQRELCDPSPCKEAGLPVSQRQRVQELGLKLQLACSEIPALLFAVSFWAN